MSTKSERTKTIEILEKEFKQAKGIFLTDFNKINVEKITKFRNNIRKNKMKYVVVKNTLARIALERCGKTELIPFLKGQTGVVLADEDGMAPARIIRDFQNECEKENKELKLLNVKVAYVDGTTFKGDDIKRLADIPPKDVLLSQLLGVLSAPMSKLAGTLNGVMINFVGVIDAVKRKKETETK
jgi:large subunit ribosomal protein L10